MTLNAPKTANIHGSHLEPHVGNYKGKLFPCQGAFWEATEGKRAFPSVRLSDGNHDVVAHPESPAGRNMIEGDDVAHGGSIVVRQPIEGVPRTNAVV
jgi:hypothetical protein